jgi:hypothetical protein
MVIKLNAGLEKNFLCHDSNNLGSHDEAAGG